MGSEYADGGQLTSLNIPFLTVQINAHVVRARVQGQWRRVMTTLTDFGRGNFNGDFPNIGVMNKFGSVGDLFLFDNNGDKEIWLENSDGGRLATSLNAVNLPFTGPTWHIAAMADFDSSQPKFYAGLG
jgi:hypothetical protein